ncbi:MAG: hypothetical protein QOD51_2458, partial [Candidatus Eremiobacteraeota bacterium]|nr:hypothetical protein [Candidatus Eremiobacteraeota bacterium]
MRSPEGELPICRGHAACRNLLRRMHRRTANTSAKTRRSAKPTPVPVPVPTPTPTPMNALRPNGSKRVTPATDLAANAARERASLDRSTASSPRVRFVRSHAKRRELPAALMRTPSTRRLWRPQMPCRLQAPPLPVLIRAPLLRSRRSRHNRYSAKCRTARARSSSHPGTASGSRRTPQRRLLRPAIGPENRQRKQLRRRQHLRLALTARAKPRRITHA